MPVGAIVGGVGAVASAGASIYGANKAADAQTNAANQANALQQQQMAQNQTNLNPFLQRGNQAGDILSMLTGTQAGGNGTGALTAAFNPTMAQLASTPGYQFSLDQGLKATQNSAAAKGLGTSGSAMKGAADYAEGLAGTTYQQQFQNYWSQNQSIYNMLAGQSGQGLQAAGALTGANSTATNAQNSNLIGAGNAQGGAATATGNAIGTGISGAVNNYQSYNLLQQMLAKNSAPTASYGNGELPRFGTSSFVGPLTQ